MSSTTGSPCARGIRPSVFWGAWSAFMAILVLTIAAAQEPTRQAAGVLIIVLLIGAAIRYARKRTPKTAGES